MTPDEIIREYAARCERVYQERTAGDHTWSGLLGDMYRECQEAAAEEDARNGRTELQRIANLRTDVRARTGETPSLISIRDAVRCGITTSEGYVAWLVRRTLAGAR